MNRRNELEDQLSYIFIKYYADLVEIGRKHPNFWTDLNSALEATTSLRVVRSVYPSQIMRIVPKTRNATIPDQSYKICSHEDGGDEIVAETRRGILHYSRGIQTDPYPAAATVATQTEISGLARSSASRYSREIQSLPEDEVEGAAGQSTSTGVGREGIEREHAKERQDAATSRPAAAQQERKQSRSRPTRNADRCWNCGSTSHLYSGCLYERRCFCYRCGRLDVTVRNCPNCGTAWKNLGPYLPDREIHLGKQPSRGTH